MGNEFINGIAVKGEEVTFYEQIISKALKCEILSMQDKVLVVAGGNTDRLAFLKNKFTNVTISNLDYHSGVSNYEPYKWERQDVEGLTYSDNEFDWVFVHAGLHHCASPHKALCEMLRVSKKGIGVFESRDSLLNKVSNKLNIVPEYELEASVISRGKYGGFRNTPIPNYVYRWTEREVRKTVNSFLPQFVHQYYFYYGLKIPQQRLAMSKSIGIRMIGGIAAIIVPVANLLFPKQGNHFSFLVTKYGKLQPWLKMQGDSIVFDLDYGDKKFDLKKYKVI